MNVKVRILLSICILTILGGIFIVGDMMNEIHHNPEYTAQSRAVATDEFGVFFMENWNGRGLLYRIDTNGSVLEMTNSGSVKMDTAEDLAVYKDRVYAIYSSECEDDDGTYRTYRIVAYDTDLKEVSVSDKFILDHTMSVRSLTADSLSVYICVIAPKGESVSVFSVPVADLHGMDTLDDAVDSKKNGKDEKVTREDYDMPDPILYRERTTERFYVDACYKSSELFVLLDGDVPEGVFAPDTRVKKAVDAISFSPVQKGRLHSGLIIKTFGLLAIWLILVILTVRVTKNRDRIVYLYSASEVVFFLILFIAFIFIKQQFQKNEIRNNTRFALMVMQEDMKYYSGVDYDSEDFYESTKYYRLMESLSDVLNENDEVEVFHDAFIMRKSTGMILTDALGHNGVHASYLYGGIMSTLLEDVKQEMGSVSSTFTLEGEELTAVAYESENPQDDLVLVAICKEKKSSERFRASIAGLAGLFITVFIVGSVFLFIALYLQHMDLKRFSSALKGLALGEKRVESPSTVSRDMRELWQCYGEIGKRIEEINYEKYRIFEAYYRFAPKGIEKIMGKESIFDVENGDVSRVSGSMVLLTVDNAVDFQKKVENLSGLLTGMERYANQSEAILVSRDQGLSNVRFLVMKEQSEMVSQLVQFIHTGGLVGIAGWSVLIYKDILTYGVAGSREQSLTYIDSEYSRKMDAYANWFRELGVPLVVTERIVRSEDVGEARFVGCAAFEGEGNEVRFYEVLDAYPAGVRQMMLINRTKFQETLDMFYSRDFYLARNQFMEILKDCPQDGVTRWYIFECEKYMNGEGDYTRSGYIQLDKKD